MSMSEQWEYMEKYLNWGPRAEDVDGNIIMDKSKEDQLNELGEEGWELIELVTWGRQCGNAMLKRRRVIMERARELGVANE